MLTLMPCIVNLTPSNMVNEMRYYKTTIEVLVDATNAADAHAVISAALEPLMRSPDNRASVLIAWQPHKAHCESLHENEGAA